MVNTFVKVLNFVWDVAKLFIIPLAIIGGLFALICAIWYMIFYFNGMRLQPSGQVKVKKPSLPAMIFYYMPRRYVLDYFEREEGYFYPKGIHMFCGEQGCGKSIACVEMITRLREQYPQSKMITNFAVNNEDDELKEWQQLLEYTNGHKGVIVGIDEIQNWFMSGLNKLPEQMLEVATQNRKNHRIICCTAQVFTRVNKGLREQVTLVYNPHTFFGCFTVVCMRKPKFDDEGNVTEMKLRGLYCFVHTDKLRNSYDTYKVIHTLAKEGFKEVQPVHETKVYVGMAKK